MSNATIVRFRLTNWHGIKLREERLTPEGVLIEGGNGTGKTSILTGLRAALTGKGVDATAVHVGADEAELLVDLQHATVRRVLKANGTSRVKVTLDDGSSPAGGDQAWLNDLYGIAPLDPVDLFEEKDPKRRRAKVLAAMPITVTPAILERWLPPGEKVTAKECEGHGLDVVERIHATIYERRTEANRVVKGTGAALTAAELKHATAASELGPDPVSAPEDIERALAEAAKNVATLEAQAEIAKTRNEQAERTRKRAADLRAEAQALRETAQKIAPSPEAMARLIDSRGELAAVMSDLQRKITDLQNDLAESMREAERLNGEIEKLSRDEAEAVKATDAAADRGARAEELEASIAGSAPVAPEAIAEARACLATLTKERERARAAVKVAELAEAAARAKAEHAAAQAKAKALDVSEKALKNDAPAALLGASGGVPGLTVEGETIRLDGVALDMLSGAEQLWFAVDIAKRMNGKRKILVIDKLEAVSPDRRKAFLEHCSSDGFQVIATCVGVGPAVAKPIGGEP